MSVKKKYAIHPGRVVSKRGGARHFIGYDALIALYEVPLDECICWDDNEPRTFNGRDYSAYIHLYPQYDSEGYAAIREQIKQQS